MTRSLPNSLTFLKNAITLAVVLIAFSCSSDDELKKSIYVADKDYPELPQYSEMGYNTFGAYYDRQVFKSSSSIIPIKVINKEGNTTFVFAGTKGLYNDPFSLSLTIIDFDPANYADLKQLSNTTCDLKDSKFILLFKDAVNAVPVQVLNGEFKFVSVHNLLVDQKNVEVTLSGIFDFQILVDDLPVTVSNGRFDVGVDRDNFYKY